MNCRMRAIVAALCVSLPLVAPFAPVARNAARRGAVLGARKRSAASAEEEVTVPEIIYNRPTEAELQTPLVPADWDCSVVHVGIFAPGAEARAQEATLEYTLWKYAPYRLRSLQSFAPRLGSGLVDLDLSLLSEDLGSQEGALTIVRGEEASRLEGLARSSPYARGGLFATEEAFVFKQNDAPELSWQLQSHPFAMVCLDAPGMLPTRAETRPAHLEYLKRSERVHAAGPLLRVGAEEDGPVGSLVVFSAASLEEARAFAEGDPYAAAGIFESTRIWHCQPQETTGRHQRSRPGLDTYSATRDMLEACELAEHWDYPEKQIFYRTLREGETYRAKEESEEVLQWNGEQLQKVTADELANVMEGEGNVGALVTEQDPEPAAAEKDAKAAKGAKAEEKKEDAKEDAKEEEEKAEPKAEEEA